MRNIVLWTNISSTSCFTYETTPPGKASWAQRSSIVFTPIFAVEHVAISLRNYKEPTPKWQAIPPDRLTRELSKMRKFSGYHPKIQTVLVYYHLRSLEERYEIFIWKMSYTPLDPYDIIPLCIGSELLKENGKKGSLSNKEKNSWTSKMIFFLKHFVLSSSY